MSRCGPVGRGCARRGCARRGRGPQLSSLGLLQGQALWQPPRLPLRGRMHSRGAPACGELEGLGKVGSQLGSLRGAGTGGTRWRTVRLLSEWDLTSSCTESHARSCQEGQELLNRHPMDGLSKEHPPPSPPNKGWAPSSCLCLGAAARPHCPNGHHTGCHKALWCRRSWLGDPGSADERLDAVDSVILKHTPAPALSPPPGSCQSSLMPPTSRWVRAEPSRLGTHSAGEQGTTALPHAGTVAPKTQRYRGQGPRGSPAAGSAEAAQQADVGLQQQRPRMGGAEEPAQPVGKDRSAPSLQPRSSGQRQQQGTAAPPPPALGFFCMADKPNGKYTGTSRDVHRNYLYRRDPAEASPS